MMIHGSCNIWSEAIEREDHSSRCSSFSFLPLKSSSFSLGRVELDSSSRRLLLSRESFRRRTSFEIFLTFLGFLKKIFLNVNFLLLFIFSFSISGLSWQTQIRSRNLSQKKKTNKNPPSCRRSKFACESF